MPSNERGGVAAHTLVLWLSAALISLGSVVEALALGGSSGGDPG
jgi:hypothetical protein